MSSSVGERWTLWQPRDRVDPGRVRGEGDVESAGVGLGLGEGGVVAAGAADDRAAGAAAAGGEQVAVGAAVEEGRARQAADQAVGAGAAVELVGAGAGLDQVVLGAAVDRVVAEAAGDADVLRPPPASLRRGGCRCRDRGRPSASAPGRRRRSRPGRSLTRVQPGPIAMPLAALMPKVDVGFVEGDGEVVVAAAADDLQAAASAGVAVEFDVGGGLRRRFRARRRPCGPWRPCSGRCPGRRSVSSVRRRR